MLPLPRTSAAMLEYTLCNPREFKTVLSRPMLEGPRVKKFNYANINKFSFLCYVNENIPETLLVDVL